jgi:hypothetical protein
VRPVRAQNLSDPISSIVDMMTYSCHPKLHGEAEIRRIIVAGQSRQKSSQDPISTEKAWTVVH